MSLFITIEGIEGAGKTTLRMALEKRLFELGKGLHFTREPGSTAVGKKLREILLSKAELSTESQTINPRTESLLFFADRAQHVESVIKPALAKNHIVVCDRFSHSTLAYQGFGRGLPLQELIEINQFATGGLEPDLVLLLDLDPQIGLRRATAREAIDPQAPSQWTRFEAEELDFHRRIRHGFLSLASADPERFLVLDAQQNPQVLAEKATQRIIEKLSQ